MGYMLGKSIKVLREFGPLNLSKRTLQYVLRHGINIVNLPNSIFKLRRFKPGCDIIESVDYAFSGCNGLISLSQIRSEIIRLLNLLDTFRPKNILEIGTAGGGTLFLFSRIASQNATIVSLDLPGGPFGGGYPFYKIPLYKSFCNLKQQLYLLRADSHKTQTLNNVKSILGNNKLDLLFIDGDHTYEGVVQDFAFYSPLVREDGIIAFHDIVEVADEGYGVAKFWREIKEKYPYEEIVENWDQGGFGIGVIRWAKFNYEKN